MDKTNNDNNTPQQSSSDSLEDVERKLKDALGIPTLTIENENSSDEDFNESSLVDEFDFAKDVDSESLFTSKEALDEIMEYDSTVHVIGIVTNVEAPVYKGENSVLLFKFIIENNTGQRVQIYAWNDDAKRITPFIHPNHIIHVDGGFAQIKNQRFSAGNTNMDLTIRGNTKINVLKKINRINSVEKPKLITIENIWNEHGLIRIEAHLKAEIKTTRMPFSNRTFESGCIAQKKNKIEIRIQSSENKIKIIRGEPISIIGKVVTEEKLPHIIIENYSKIVKLNGRCLPENELMNASIIPKRKPDMDTDVQSKKTKKE